MKSVLLDASCIVALLDADEPRHKQCLALVTSLPPPLYTCEAVIAESCHLLRHRHDGSRRRGSCVDVGSLAADISWAFGGTAHRSDSLLRLLCRSRPAVARLVQAGVRGHSFRLVVGRDPDATPAYIGRKHGPRSDAHQLQVHRPCS